MKNGKRVIEHYLKHIGSHRVHIKTSDDIDSGLIPLPLLAGERIVLKYEPTSGSIADPLGDESLFRLLDEGGRDWYVGYYTWGYWLTGPTWAYAYPRLLIDNETVSVGSSSKLGEWRELYFNFSIAGEFMLETKWIHVGNMYSLVLSPGREFPDRITEEASRVTELYQGYNASGSASDYDSFVAQMLHATGMAFFAAYDKTRGLGKEVFLAENYPVTVRNDYVSRHSRYWEDWYLSWGAGDVYARYRPAGVAHDFQVHITKTYSRIGQSEGRVAFRLLPSGFAGSGWESQSIYALYNVTSVSATYILAWAQNHSIPVYTINQSNYAELVPKLRVDQWLRDRVTRAAQSGRVVIIPDRYLRIEKWYGTGWTELDPTTGAGGYLIVGVMTYMREGEAGNASIRLGPEHVSVGGHAAQPMDMSYSWEDFVDYSQNLSKGLENVTEAEKREAAEEVAASTMDLYEHIQFMRIVIGLDIGLALVVLLTHAPPPPSVLALYAFGNVFAATLLYLDIRTIIEKGRIAMDPEGEVLW
jgi:hypothetical protein